MMKTVVGTTNNGTKIKRNEVTGEIERHISFDERAEELRLQDELEKKKKEREKKNTYKNFYQINRKYSSSLISLAHNAPKASEIFQFLLLHMDKYNALICSTTVICEALNISRATAQRGIKYLKENGFIDIAKSGTTNIYIVNPDIAWSSWGKNKKYCKFSASVIISATENDDLLNKSITKQVTLK